MVRYEKGNFQSGYCIVESKKIAIVNKFYDTEGRINVLLDILSHVGTDIEALSGESIKLFNKLIVQTAEEEKDSSENKKGDQAAAANKDSAADKSNSAKSTKLKRKSKKSSLNAK